MKIGKLGRRWACEPEAFYKFRRLIYFLGLGSKLTIGFLQGVTDLFTLLLTDYTISRLSILTFSVINIINSKVVNSTISLLSSIQTSNLTVKV